MDLSIDTGSGKKEEPVAVLLPDKLIFWLGVVVTIGIYLFYIFGVILPVLQTGDYASVWPENDRRIVAKMSLFYIACLAIFLVPGALPPFRKGVSFFYADRLEVLPYIGRRKIVIPYAEMIATLHGDYRIVMYRCDAACRFNVWRRLTARYMRGIAYGLRYRDAEHQEKVKQIIRLLEASAAVFKRKMIS